MNANRAGLCPRCHLTIRVGDAIKPEFRPAGIVNGRMTFRRGQGYVHAKCPRVDERTGEIR